MSAGKHPFLNGYQPELKQSDELILELESCYLQLIVILRWAVELGHIYIFTEVTIMLQYSASPQSRHIEGLYRVFEYLSRHDISRVVFYMFQPNFDESVFALGIMDWKDLYREIKEELPPGMLDPLGKNAHTTFFC